MTAYLEHMPAGFPGDASRLASLTAEARFIGATPPDAHGLAVKLDATTGTLLPLNGDVAVYGFLLRVSPAQDWSEDQDGSPKAGEMADVMRRGYMVVKCNAGTPVAGGTVYVRYANAGADTPLGGVEAAAVATETKAIAATFMGAADDDGNVEIAYNI